MLSNLIHWWKERQKTRREALMFERQVIVASDEAGVTATFPAGERQVIAWGSVSCIAIETNDSGPWGADVWWLLEGAGGRVAYPQGAAGDGELLDEFPKRFPAFNHDAVIRAMGSTEHARFVCWERADGL